LIRFGTLARLHADARLRNAMLALWCVGWAVIVVVSLIPLEVPGPSGSDKVLHLLVHAVMSAGGLAFCATRGGLVRVALVCILIGVGIELAQGLVPHRNMSLADAVANTAGAVLGLAVALWALPALRRF
jgi:VanZ family protein